MPPKTLELSLEHTLFFFTNSLAIIAIAAVIFFSLGVWFGWLTWARYKRKARAYQEETDLLRHEIARLKRRIADEAMLPSVAPEPSGLPSVSELLGTGDVLFGATPGTPEPEPAGETARVISTPLVAEPRKESLAAALGLARPAAIASAATATAVVAESVTNEQPPAPTVEVTPEPVVEATPVAAPLPITVSAPVPASPAGVAKSDTNVGVTLATPPASVPHPVSQAPISPIALAARATAAIRLPTLPRKAVDGSTTTPERPISIAAPAAMLAAPVVVAPVAPAVEPPAAAIVAAPEAAPEPLHTAAPVAAVAVTAAASALTAAINHGSALAAAVTSGNSTIEPTVQSAVQPEPEPEPEAAIPAPTELPNSPSTGLAPDARNVSQRLFATELAKRLVHIDRQLGVRYLRKPERWDDLTLLRGIAEVMQGRLQDNGIYTFKQIALWTADNSREIAVRIHSKDRIEREQWIQQARDLHYLKYGERLDG
jgi:predicted flap endonuclease-1-like 5' DNA nuclease